MREGRKDREKRRRKLWGGAGMSIRGREEKREVNGGGQEGEGNGQ